MTLEQYIDNLNKRYRLGNATEHTFRGDLQQLLESLVPEITSAATNPPKNGSKTAKAEDWSLTIFCITKKSLWLYGKPIG